MKILYLILSFCLPINLLAWEINTVTLESGKKVHCKIDILESKVELNLQNLFSDNFAEEVAEDFVRKFMEGPLDKLFSEKNSDIDKINKEISDLCRVDPVLGPVYVDFFSRITTSIVKAIGCAAEKLDSVGEKEGSDGEHPSSLSQRSHYEGQLTPLFTEDEEVM